MRKAILATILASTLVTGRLQAETPPKTPPADIGPGRIAWFDITTTSLPQSKDFYGKLFDWQFTPVQGTDQAAEIVAGGTPIGTLRVAEGKITPFNGVVYVQVTDLQASCKKAKELGGTIPLASPSTCRTASEPSPWSSIQPATRSGSTRGPRSRRHPPRPSEGSG